MKKERETVRELELELMEREKNAGKRIQQLKEACLVLRNTLAEKAREVSMTTGTR